MFLDNEDDATPHFRGFSISHEKQIVKDLLKYAKEVTCEEAKFQNSENLESVVPRPSG
jgi:hypothetical protein